jgi:hypothetical protein
MAARFAGATLSLGRGGTFSWLSRNRRTSRDYELLCTTGEVFIYVAMSR